MSASAQVRVEPPAGPVPQRLFVRWTDEQVARSAIDRAPPCLEAVRGRVTWASDLVPGLSIIEVEDGFEDLAAELLRLDRDIRYVHRDAWVMPLTVPNDPLWPSQAATLDRLCVQSLWSYRTVATKMVAVVDSGVDFSNSGIPNPDLAGNLVTNPLDPIDAFHIDDDGNGFPDDFWGSEFLPPMPFGTTFPLPRDRSFHGTQMASIIGAVGDNSNEMTGVAWAVPMLAVKATDNLGVGSASSYLQGMEFAFKRGARIINCSWQVYGSDPSLTALYEFFVDTPECLYVVAAGNSGVNLDAHCIIQFPAMWSLDNMLVVGASTSGDVPWASGPVPNGPCDASAGTTNYGLSSVDVFAPGFDVWGLSQDGLPAAPGSGTSQAAAMVSAVAALVWSEFPTMSALQVKDRIMSKADALPTLSGLCVTGGRVNAARAVGVDCP